jgi:hypothetical protein
MHIFQILAYKSDYKYSLQATNEASISVIGIIFMLGKFPGNKSFENQIAYFFSMYI